MDIFFTKHAEEKFVILRKYGFKVSKIQVIDTLKRPEFVDRISRHPLVIAQKTIDRDHVLRVVSKIEYNVIVVITFYPGRIKKYGKKGRKTK